ncbi:MAG TPA: hypothetical protein VIP31_05010 [Acidovorax sp.]
MVRALSLGGWWNFHSRKVPRATIRPKLTDFEQKPTQAPASQARVAINSEARQLAQGVA